MKLMAKKLWRNQQGITGLETAIVLIAFVVVAAVFAFAVITTGLFSSEKAAETATAGLAEASTTLSPKGAVIAQSNSGADAIATVKFKLANGGAESIALTPANTLLTYSDSNNLVTLTRAADSTGSAEVAPWWWSSWQLGSGDSLDSGELVEITVGLFTTASSTTVINEGSAYLAADTTLTVGDGTQFAVGQTIYIESEQLSVNAIAGNDLTVARGINATTAADHADALQIDIVKSQLDTDLISNVAFKVQLIPAEGAPFTLTRVSPVEIKPIMDLG